MMIPRLVIAGTHSGVGKTTVATGLMAAFAARGMTVQPFKVGPDYLDPTYHAQATGRTPRNLDAWLLGADRIPALVQRAMAGASLAVIEGVMGLYDGISGHSDAGSTADAAKRLRAPVVLVVDASRLARSVAAVVQGYVGFDREVRIAGLLFNRVAGERHYAILKAALAPATAVPLLGYLPHEPAIQIPERHLGLIPAAERPSRTPWPRAAALMARTVDLDRLWRIARQAPPLAVRPDPRVAEESPAPRQSVRIGVARDACFHFYYPEHFELLEQAGAELVPFSPLVESRLPASLDALYIGGGFPEIFASPLARNTALRTQLRRVIAEGLPTYAECGGLMYLTQALTDGAGRRWPMVGALPGAVRMTDRLQRFGYKRVQARRDSVVARAGERARGHEFHHSVWDRSPAPATAAYDAAPVSEGASRPEGYAARRLAASYIHVHWYSQPRWPARFVDAARRWQALAALCLCGMCGLAFADEPTRLEEIIVTASKAKTPAKSVTRAVSVIPAEELSVVKGGFVSDAFSDVSETLVRRTGSIGRTTAVVVRGASAPQVHVTLDGAHVASPTTGSFDFNHFTPDNLERIEILRGPGSTLYGSDAMGGVINLVTVRGEGPMKVSYTQEYGGLDTSREVASVQGAVGRWHLSGAVARLDSDGISQNDDYQNTNVSARIGYDLTDAATLDLSIRHLFAIIGLDDGAFRPDPNRRDRDRLTITTAKWETPVTPWWSQMVRTSAQIGNLIDSDPSDGGTQANALTKLDTERYGAEWLNRFTPVAWDTVLVGLEFDDREADRRTGGANQNFSKAMTTWAVYLQNQWQPIEPLTVVAGVRRFRESDFGHDQVFDASAAYFVAPWNMKFRGGWGQGFRVPSLNELFFPNFGNPDLAPEKSETVEIGVDQVLWDDAVSWSGTLFRTDYENLIQTVRLTPTRSQPQNIGQSRIDGAEVELALKSWDPWTFAGSYTHLEAHERPSGEELLRIPKNILGFRARYAPPAARWETRLEGLLVSSREESTGTNQRNKTKGYLKLDWILQYRFTPWARAHLRIDNLTNRTYSEILGFPAAGTVVTVGLTVER